MFNETEELLEYFDKFLEHPILPQQEAQIVAAVENGTITKDTAKELYKQVMQMNLEKYQEFISLSKEDILKLIEEGKTDE
jgi:hypothetical protein